MSKNDKKDIREMVGKIVSDFEQEKDLKIKREENERCKKKKMVAVRQAVLAISFSLALIFCVSACVVLFGETKKVHQKRGYWAVGSKKGSDPRINDEIGRFWEVRRLSDAYYAKNKRYPDSLSVFYDQRSLRVELACSISGKPFIEKELDGKTAICCPNPESHGVSEIGIYIKGGPPFIKND